MSERYYKCTRCSKVTRNVSALLSEAPDIETSGEGLKPMAMRFLLGAADAGNFLVGGLLVKGIGLVIGGEPYKCTECGYVRVLAPNGDETGLSI